MTIPTLLLPLDGDLDGRDRDGPITATGNGALRWVPGMAPGTQAALVEEATTNLVWRPINASAAFDIQSDNIHHGRWERVSAGGYAYMHRSAEKAYPAGTTLTFSGEWRGAVTGSSYPSVQAWENVGGGHAQVGVLAQTVQEGGPPTSEYKPYRFTVTISTDLELGSLEPLLSNMLAGVGDWLEVRNAQIEEKAYPTSFCPQYDHNGNLLPGYSWTGTEHASPSTRTVSHLSFNPMTNGRVPLDRGTIALRARFSDIGSSGRDQIAFSHYSAGQNRLYLGRRGNGTGMVSIGGLHPAILGGSVPPEEWVDLAMQYDGERVWLRVNDETFGPVSYSGLNQLSVTASIGRSDSDNSPSAAVGGVIVTSDLLSDDEWARLRQQPEWRWNTLIPTPGGVLRVDGGGAPFSVLRSGSGGAPFSVLRAGYGEE